MLNSSAVLNGQPAILAWSVTSIQPPPETIRACPINQPIHYLAIQQEPTSILVSPVAFQHPFVTLATTRTVRASVLRSDTSPTPPSFPFFSWQTARSTSKPTKPPRPSGLLSTTNSTPSRSHANPLHRVSTIFFHSLSNPCPGVCPLNESSPRRCASSNVHNRETCDACHRLHGVFGVYRKCSPFSRAFFIGPRESRAEGSSTSSRVLNKLR